VSPTKTLNDLCVHNISSGGEWNNTGCTSHRCYSPSYRNGINQGLEAIMSDLPILEACVPLKPKRPKLLLVYSTGGTIGHFMQSRQCIRDGCQSAKLCQIPKCLFKTMPWQITYNWWKASPTCGQKGVAPQGGSLTPQAQSLSKRTHIPPRWKSP
jgi:hypothetical protein